MNKFVSGRVSDEAKDIPLDNIHSVPISKTKVSRGKSSTKHSSHHEGSNIICDEEMITDRRMIKGSMKKGPGGSQMLEDDFVDNSKPWYVPGKFQDTENPYKKSSKGAAFPMQEKLYDRQINKLEKAINQGTGKSLKVMTLVSCFFALICVVIVVTLFASARSSRASTYEAKKSQLLKPSYFEDHA